MPIHKREIQSFHVLIDYMANISLLKFPLIANHHYLTSIFTSHESNDLTSTVSSLRLVVSLAIFIVS